MNGEKKVVSRKFAMEMAVLCVVLIVIAGVLEAQIFGLQNQVSMDKATIKNLNSQLSLDPNRIVDGFSIIQITDTQYLSDSHPNLYDGLTSWIADKTNALNLTMVVHSGDIADVANSVADWGNASNAMMTLYNNGIPYCWDAGNHDQLNSTAEGGGGNPNGSWIGRNFPAFNVTMMQKKPYWVGDIIDGKNTAVQFSYNNYHFMVINVEYNANVTVLDWMQTLIKANQNVNVIVATHNFLNGAGTYGTSNIADAKWATNFEKLLNNYPNVFMTLNGHSVNSGTGYNHKVRNREEIFFNRQAPANEQGAASARIYTFEISNSTNAVVDVYTYQTFGTPQYLTDPKDQFSFSTTLKAHSP